MSRQRVRDPIHDLIIFEETPLDAALWEAVKSRPFQRLRRVRQLGFSEYVYPGATHTRYAHSLGVFHTAKQLMLVVEREMRKLGEEKFSSERADRALAAALLHDLGHGPFSHAFETVKARLGLKPEEHEIVSQQLIQDGEIAELFDEKKFGSGFAADVAKILREPSDIYSAVVSSQFDADRLDYMRRDPFMTGSKHARIDFQWLIDNLRVGTIKTGSDDSQGQDIQTLVLDRKAAFAAEAYILGVFQLYPTIYFHKATRAAEAMFTEMLLGTMTAAIEHDLKSIGLPSRHPLVQYARNSEKLSTFLELDDTVVWGSLHLLASAKDPFIKEMALRLKHRQLFKAIDVRERVTAEARKRYDTTKIASTVQEQSDNRYEMIDPEIWEDLIVRTGRAAFIKLTEARIAESYQDLIENDPAIAKRILIDRGKREVYKRLATSKHEQQQVYVSQVAGGGEFTDIGATSPTIRATPNFEFFRFYTREKDGPDAKIVSELIENALREDIK